MPNQPEVPAFTRLAALATTNIWAAKVVKMLADANLAERNGLLLRDVKEKLPHGKFEQWVADNCKFSIRTAQRYMEAISATVAFMPNQPEVPVFTRLAALATTNIWAAKVVKMLADANIRS